MKVAICVPSGDLVHWVFTASLVDLVSVSRAAGIVPWTINTRSSIIDHARFRLVEGALDLDVDKLLFVDADMGFPPDALLRLLGREQTIVGATYPSRHAATIHGTAIDHSTLNGCGLAEMKSLPFGMMLVDRSVFETLPRPWFKTEWDAERSTFVGEDVTFCTRAREAGFQVWCDLDLSHEIIHLGVAANTWTRETP